MSIGSEQMFERMAEAENHIQASLLTDTLPEKHHHLICAGDILHDLETQVNEEAKNILAAIRSRRQRECQKQS